MSATNRRPKAGHRRLRFFDDSARESKLAGIFPFAERIRQNCTVAVVRSAAAGEAARESQKLVPRTRADVPAPPRSARRPSTQAARDDNEEGDMASRTEPTHRRISRRPDVDPSWRRSFITARGRAPAQTAKTQPKPPDDRDPKATRPSAGCDTNRVRDRLRPPPSSGRPWNANQAQFQIPARDPKKPGSRGCCPTVHPVGGHTLPPSPGRKRLCVSYPPGGRRRQVRFEGRQCD